VRAGPIALATIVLAAGCGGADSSGREAAPRPPEERVVDRGRINDPEYPIAVRDLSLPARRGRVEAYVAAAARTAPRAAVVYVHGQGGDRQQLLVPATWLAARGAVAVTITAPSSRARPQGPLQGVEALEWQRDLARRDVDAVRAALDYLAGRPDVDATRLGLVGWSAGARTGALAAGSERRLRAVVLMSGGAEPVSAYVDASPPHLRLEVRRVLSGVDPLRSLARSRASVLIQNGRRDEVVPKPALELLAEAAPEGADVRWYDAPHELNDAAFRDQLAWLRRELALEGPPVRGARTGP
jgi:dienelactone hydrolase